MNDGELYDKAVKIVLKSPSLIGLIVKNKIISRTRLLKYFKNAKITVKFYDNEIVDVEIIDIRSHEDFQVLLIDKGYYAMIKPEEINAVIFD